MSAVSRSVMPTSSAASTTARVPSRSTRPPKLLQPMPTTETSGPPSPSVRVRIADILTNGRSRLLRLLPRGFVGPRDHATARPRKLASTLAQRSFRSTRAPPPGWGERRPPATRCERSEERRTGLCRLRSDSRTTESGVEQVQAGHAIPPARRERPGSLRDQPRVVAYLRRRRRTRVREGVRRQSLRPRDQFLRHRKRLRARRRRVVARGVPRTPAARVVRPGDEALLSDEWRPRPLARAGAQADRALARSSAHRLRRPIPVPPL